MRLSQFPLGVTIDRWCHKKRLLGIVDCHCLIEERFRLSLTIWYYGHRSFSWELYRSLESGTFRIICITTNRVKSRQMFVDIAFLLFLVSGRGFTETQPIQI